MFAIYQILFGKHVLGVNISMKPTNSPSQGQRNPRKTRFPSGIWASFFAQQFCFRGLGLVLYQEADKKPNPTEIPSNTLLIIVTDVPALCGCFFCPSGVQQDGDGGVGVPLRAGLANGPRHHPPRQPRDVDCAGPGRVGGGEERLPQNARPIKTILKAPFPPSCDSLALSRECVRWHAEMAAAAAGGG